MAPTSPRSSWWHDLLSSLAVASGVGYVATAYTISRWLTRVSRAHPRRPEADPHTRWEDIFCRTADGLRLAGWCAEPRRAHGTVMLFHGLRGNRSDMLTRMHMLTRAGYRCIAFDHRGHGQSQGSRTSFGYHEGRDVDAVIDFVDKRWPHEPRAAVGFSMGAAALCFAAHKSRRLSAVVLESMYHDLGSAFHSRVGRTYPAWFNRFRRGVVWVTEKRLGVRIEQVAPVEQVEKLAPAPVLLMTGTEDPHAPVEDAERLYQRCRDPRELHLVEGANHTDLCDKGGKTYRDKLLGFLERHLTRAIAA